MWHDMYIHRRKFEVGQQVLLYNSRLKPQIEVTVVGSLHNHKGLSI